MMMPPIQVKASGISSKIANLIIAPQTSRRKSI